MTEQKTNRHTAIGDEFDTIDALITLKKLECQCLVDAAVSPEAYRTIY